MSEQTHEPNTEETPLEPDTPGAGDDDASLEPDEDDERHELHAAQPPAPPAPPTSDVDIEKGIKKLESEATRHANRVSEIMGADAQSLVPCELCAPMIPGFRFPIQPAPEVAAAVRAAIGDAPAADYKADGYSRACDTCGGLGEVLTGSLVRGRELLPCLACKGNGWVAVGTERASATVTQLVPVQPPAAVAAAEPAAPPSTDVWGRPEGHPHFGVPPAMVGA